MSVGGDAINKIQALRDRFLAARPELFDQSASPNSLERKKSLTALWISSVNEGIKLAILGKRQEDQRIGIQGLYKL